MGNPGELVHESIDRTNDFKQAGETYRAFDNVERDELINNLVDKLKTFNTVIQENMIDMCTKADKDYGRRLAVGLRQHADANKMEHDTASSSDSGEAVKQAEEKGHTTDSY